MASKTFSGRFVWHELYTPNAAAAREFYGSVLGWQVESWEQDASYQMFVAPSGPLGASVETPGVPPRWVSLIGTDDVDATVEAAKRLGGSVVTEPASIPNVGRYAVLADPHGGVFGVYASQSEESPPEGPPGPGEFSWHELATTVDPREALPFYAELFGWTINRTADMGGELGIYLVFELDGVALGGMFDKGSSGRPGPAYWLGYVRVDDLEAAVASATAAHASLLVPPMTVPSGERIAQLADPDGGLFALHWTPAAAAPESHAPAEPAPDAAEEPDRPPQAAAAPESEAEVAELPAEPVTAEGAAKDEPVVVLELEPAAEPEVAADPEASAVRSKPKRLPRPKKAPAAKVLPISETLVERPAEAESAAEPSTELELDPEAPAPKAKRTPRNKLVKPALVPAREEAPAPRVPTRVSKKTRKPAAATASAKARPEPAKKVAAQRVPAKKTPAKKAPLRAPVKRLPVKKAAPNKLAPRKTSAKRPAARPVVVQQAVHWRVLANEALAAAVVERRTKTPVPRKTKKKKRR